MGSLPNHFFYDLNQVHAENFHKLSRKGVKFYPQTQNQTQKSARERKKFYLYNHLNTTRMREE